MVSSIKFYPFMRLYLYLASRFIFSNSVETFYFQDSVPPPSGPERKTPHEDNSSFMAPPSIKT